MGLNGNQRDSYDRNRTYIHNLLWIHYYAYRRRQQLPLLTTVDYNMT